MLRTRFVSVVGVSSTSAMLGVPANAEDADVQALKQEVAALQKKLNVLEKQEQVDRAQQQTAIQSVGNRDFRKGWKRRRRSVEALWR